MEGLVFKDNKYKTELKDISIISKIFPSIVFYIKTLFAVSKIGWLAKKSRCNYKEMHDSSLAVLRAIESVGVVIDITGTDNLKKIDSPCVIIANHMSTLETLVLASIILPFKKMTFVIKEEIMRYPLFKYAMVAAKTIPVGRKNPREDFKAVMEGGVERLNMGISLVIFPQTTRYTNFNPETFNTIGIKLAKRANVPVIPLALKTDAWSIGKYIKDLGRIYPTKKVYFAFGEPLWIKGTGAEEHKLILEFIRDKLIEWNRQN